VAKIICVMLLLLSSVAFAASGPLFGTFNGNTLTIFFNTGTIGDSAGILGDSGGQLGG